MSPPPYTTIPLHTASTVYCTHCILQLLCHCIHCIHWFDFFEPKTMSLPPYITIPLCPLHTASTGLTFLHQRTMSPPLFHCTLHPLHSLVWPFCTKDNVPTTIYHYSTASTASYGLTFLHQRQCPHHHIPLFHCILRPLRTASTVYCIHCILCTASTVYCIHWFDPFAQRQCPHHHIPLFKCILHPLVWRFCTKDNVRITIYHYSTAYCIHCILCHCVLCPLHTASTADCIHCMPYMAYVGNLFALTKHPRYPPMLLITHESTTNQKLFISNQYLMSPPPTKKVPKSYTFLAAWPI